MQFDYYLLPSKGATFSGELLSEACHFLKGLPSHRWPNGVFTVFRNERVREEYLPYLLEHPDELDPLNGYVKLAPDEVKLGLVLDGELLEHLHRFTLWFQRKCPGAALFYAGKEIPVSKIISD
jgi:hypothetical protein